jgi:hypothetical protein
MAMAMPAAADTKFCTVRARTWVRWLIVASPEYHCQFVFVTKLIATFHAPHGVTAPRSVGFNGSEPCTRWMAYTNNTDARLKASSDTA